MKRLAVWVAVLVALLVPRLALADETCASDWKKRVYFASRDSVVRIEPIGFSLDGLFPMGGFVFATRSHVVALSGAIGVGRGANVYFANGQVIHARGVAVDEENDISILALDSEGPAQPLELGDVQLGVGDEVAALAAVEGEVRDDEWMQLGHVANAGDRGKLRFDGAETYMRGSPIFTCDGRVVAVRRGNVLVPSERLRALQPHANSYVKDRWWSLAHAHVGFLVQADSTRAYLGGSFGLSAVYADRIQLRLGAGVLAGLPKTGEVGGVDNVQTARFQLEPTIGYRFLLTDKLPLYVVPQIGGVGRFDITTNTHTTFIATNPSCFQGPGPCELGQSTSTSSKSSWGASPVLGVSLLGVVAGVSYQWQMDVSDVRKSTHQIFFGLEF
jgi:hypothetical protein